MKFRLSEQKLTGLEILEFEREFKLKLPKSYHNIISKYNGGYPEKKYFEGNTVLFLPIKYGDWNLNESLLITKDVIPKNSLPFADFKEGSLYMSLNKDDYEKIYFFDESGEYELVADSFDDFMNQLSNDPHY